MNGTATTRVRMGIDDNGQVVGYILITPIPNVPAIYIYLSESTGGAERAKKFAENWPEADLDESIDKFSGESPIVTTTDKGKRIYENTENGVQVVEDTSGNYFRIYDPNLSGKRKYLDLDGNIPNNKTLPNGKQVGRSQGEYNQVTHFKIKR